VTYARYHRWFAKLVDHRVRVLVDHGRLRRDQLVICGLTENDLLSQLRQAGIEDLGQLRYVLYETKGNLTCVREDGSESPSALWRGGLQDAAGWPDPGHGRG
jgi:uncharacterized membrane protein YcaP (DUF421 family)